MGGTKEIATETYGHTKWINQGHLELLGESARKGQRKAMGRKSNILSNGWIVSIISSP